MIFYEKKVSLLIPVYNVESFLDRCIQSIFNQTYKNIEIVLVDDCSTDNSLSMCYEYAKKDNRVKVIKKETHTCISDVRNIGIENATGKYIMFVDSDDFVRETFVEDMVNAIETKNVDVVRCKAIKHKKDGSLSIENLRGYEDRIVRRNEYKDLIPHFVTLKESIGCYSWALIIRKDILNVRYDPKAFCRQDYIFINQLLLTSASSIYFLDKPLYEYCYNSNSISNNGQRFFKYIEGLLYTEAAIRKILKEHGLLSKAIEQEKDKNIIDTCFLKTQTLLKPSVFTIYKALKQIFKMDDLQQIIKNVNQSHLNVSKRIRLYLIKKKMYFLLALCVRIKHTHS